MPEQSAPAAPETTVSVVIPVYNGADTIGRAVASVLSQEVDPGWTVEVIVVDDGSDDDPAAALAGCGPAVRCLRQDNAGPSAARNRGIAAACGAYVAFLDSDDEWLPGFLRAGLAPLAADPGTSMSYAWAYLRRPDGRQSIRNLHSPSHDAEHRLLWPNPMQITSGTICRRAALDAVGAFDEALRMREDLDLWIRLGEAGTVAQVSRVLVVSHETGTSYSFRHSLETQRADYLRIIEKALARAPERYGPRAERIRAEAYRYWGQYALYKGDVARAREDLGRSLSMRPRLSTLALAALARLPASILAPLRGLYSWARRRKL